VLGVIEITRCVNKLLAIVDNEKLLESMHGYHVNGQCFTQDRCTHVDTIEPDLELNTEDLTAACIVIMHISVTLICRPITVH